MKKRFGMILLVIFTIGTLSACGSSDIEDQIVNLIQSEDSHVLSVKGGTSTAYPGKTYGEAFENFFGSPTWKYFVGTKEGADEDGDGKPDYTEENVDIVEFTGYCTYQDIEVKALIQFTLSKDDDTFEATYLSFNEVPQNMFMLYALLEAAFTDEDIDSTVNNDSNGTEQENNDALLDGFSDHAAEYVGTWLDTYSQRCYMEISSYDGISYSIDIDWGSSAWDNTHWSFYGTYDEIAGGIRYSGSRIEEYYPDYGEKQETYVYYDGEGLIWLGDDGLLYWADYTEQQGIDCAFERLEINEENEYKMDENVGENKNSEYLLQYSDSQYLSEADLQGFTAEECRIARNEIYARHGRIFQDESLRSYFEQFDWYSPKYEAENFDESVLNEYEMANRDLIIEYESKMGYR